MGVGAGLLRLPGRQHGVRGALGLHACRGAGHRPRRVQPAVGAGHGGVLGPVSHARRQPGARAPFLARRRRAGRPGHGDRQPRLLAAGTRRHPRRRRPDAALQLRPADRDRHHRRRDAGRLPGGRPGRRLASDAGRQSRQPAANGPRVAARRPPQAGGHAASRTGAGGRHQPSAAEELSVTREEGAAPDRSPGGAGRWGSVQRADPDGGGRRAPARGLRRRGGVAAVPRRRAPDGDGDSIGARRHASRSRPAVAGREPAGRRGRRSSWASRWRSGCEAWSFASSRSTRSGSRPCR